MFACPKELRCIEIASPIIKKGVLLKVNKLKASNNPILGIRLYSEIAGLEDLQFNDEKMIFKSFLYLTLIIVLYPAAFLSQFIFSTFFDFKRKKETIKQIRALLKKCQINYIVSEKKSFVQLWSDKGLRDFGLRHIDEGPFSYEDKFHCLFEWIKILYYKDFDLKEFENIIHERETIKLIAYRKNNPGVRLTPAQTIDLIPFEIDKMFGDYKVDDIKKVFYVN